MDYISVRVLPFQRYIQIKQVEGELLTTLQFLPRSILTATKGGLIKLWIRPLALRPRHMKSARAATFVDAQALMT